MFTRHKPPEPPTQWSIETLREYLLALITANDLRYGQRHDASQAAITATFLASEKAISKVEVATEKRFESVNEFRATLSDQQRNFMPRLESEALIRSLTEKIEAMEKTLAALSGQRSGMSTAIGVAIAIGGIVIGILSHFLK